MLNTNTNLYRGLKAEDIIISSEESHDKVNLINFDLAKRLQPGEKLVNLVGTVIK